MDEEYYDEEDRDIYSDEGREDMVESDEIEPWEEGFMRGAEGLGQDAKCRRCGKIFMGPETVIEADIDGEVMRFCSEECVKKFKERLIP